MIVVAVFATTGIEFNNSNLIIEGKKTIVLDGKLPSFTVDDLAKRSKYLIIGTVTDITSTQPIVDELHTVTKIYSDVTVKLENDLTGQYTGNQITVRIQGGETDTVRVISEIDPQFAMGQRVLLFVADKEPDTIWGDHYYVTGLKLGKYDLIHGKAVGPEHPDGIDELQFTAKIKQIKNVTVN
jgi:hypothetical protein